MPSTAGYSGLYEKIKKEDSDGDNNRSHRKP